MTHFQPYNKENYQSLIKYREGETKLGECIQTDWQHPAVRFVLVGIAEDIGVRLNRGIGGTQTAWAGFISAFLNVQSTNLWRNDIPLPSVLRGGEIGIAGHFNFEDLQDDVQSQTVEIIDAEVAALIEKIVTKGKIPIVIGGGHNNAYPILKGCSLAIKKPINTINLDAHADFRRKEGRHSGNGFRYAYEEGFLKKYAIIGLHQNYNAPSIIDELTTNPDIWFCYWEDLFLTEKLSYKKAIQKALTFTDDAPTGIELDMDCIENMLSSAITPCGLSPTQARQYIHTVAQKSNVAYLHICEGIFQLETGEKNPTLGKLISYLVSDFIKAVYTKPKVVFGV
jgi:formiminoglutamase